MATATLKVLGPADHGRLMSYDEFASAPWDENYRFELVDGRLFVSPVPEAPHDSVWCWLHGHMFDYTRSRPDVLNLVTPHGRIFIPGQERRTSIQPDLSGYRDYPFHLPARQRRWKDMWPILAAEILSEDNAEKDLVRNVRLLLLVPSVREYWIFDPREDPDRPSLIVYRRRGASWQRPIELPAGDKYTTKLLPGFSLLLDPLA